MRKMNLNVDCLHEEQMSFITVDNNKYRLWQTQLNENVKMTQIQYNLIFHSGDDGKRVCMSVKFNSLFRF